MRGRRGRRFAGRSDDSNAVSLWQAVCRGHQWNVGVTMTQPAPETRSQFFIGCIYAARRFWCGVVGHDFAVGKACDFSPVWCKRCNWWGGFAGGQVHE